MPRGLLSVIEYEISKMNSVLSSLVEVYYMDKSKVYLADMKGDTYAEKCKYLASEISLMIKQKLGELRKQGIELESKSNCLQNLFNGYSNYIINQETEISQLL